MKSLLLGLVGAASLLLPVTGQVAVFEGPPRAVRLPVVGFPYSADRVTTVRTKAPDGQWITREDPVINVSRDAAGRTRTERVYEALSTASTLGKPKERLVIVEIEDPVSRFRYVVDTRAMIAHRIRLPEPQAAKRTNNQGVPSFVAPSGAKIESLGKQIIEGVLCEGTRVTTPLDAAGGAVVSVNEEWGDPLWKLAVLMKHVHPVHGTTVIELKNLKRTNPDPQLFAVPEKFTVVDETGPFSIRVLPEDR